MDGFVRICKGRSNWESRALYVEGTWESMEMDMDYKDILYTESVPVD